MTTMLAPAIDQSARFRNGVVHDVEWDVYLYGWREVPHPSPNGTSQMVRIPLTRKDVLHPQVGDFRMHSDNHERFCIYLYNVLTAQLADDPTAVVLHDVRVAWAAPDVDPHGPDLAVIWDVKARKNWSTFDEKVEGSRPGLIIEVTSPRTRSLDLVDKVDEYEAAKVPYYVIIDRYRKRSKTHSRLLGYQLTSSGYVSLQPNEQGWLWIEPVQIWLALKNHQVICYDKHKRPFKGYAEVSDAYLQAKNRAAQETYARMQAEARAETEAKARAKAEARIEVETLARAKAEARIHELEAEVRRLRDEMS